MSARSLPTRVLCLDIEGGHGGSSRSLYELLRHIDRDLVAPEIVCRRDGPILAKYQALGIACHVAPAMPKVSSVPRISRNLIVYGLALREFLRAREFRHWLVAEIADRFDIVHFNHEALFLLARWLRPRTSVPFSMHVRTNLRDTSFARWQTRSVSRTVDHLLYITENERERLERQAGRATTGSVIFNIVTPLPEGTLAHSGVPDDGRFKIASLSNYAWDRGLDRLIEVAKALNAPFRDRVLFVMAGDMKLSRSLPGLLGRTARQGGTLKDFAEGMGVGDMFHFLGHVSEPERVIAACDALIKPTRHDNPWGRDIAEALAAGLPVLSIGTWDKFVETGRTGTLLPHFDAEAFAREIMRLAEDRDDCRAMGERGKQRILRLCDGSDRAREICSVWRELEQIGRRGRQPVARGNA